MAYTLSYDSYDLSATPFFMTLQSFSRPVLASIRQDVRGLGIYNGSKALGGSRDGVSLVCELHTFDTTPTLVEAKINALRYLLDPKSDKKIATSMIPGQYWMGRPMGEVTLEAYDETGSIISLQFFCPLPYAYSTTLQTVVNAGGSFTILAAAVAASSEDIWPTFVVRNTGGTPLTNLVIENQTTSEILTWHGSLPVGWRMKIETETLEVFRSADGVTWEYYMLGKTGFYTSIRPRVNNYLVVTPTGSTIELTTTFRERFKA